MLRWQRDWADKSPHWEAMIAQGRPAPEPYLDRPELMAVCVFLMQAFHDLGTERQIGMGMGPIPRSKAKEYAAEHGIDTPDHLDDFWSVLHAVDAEYLAMISPSKEGASQKDGDRSLTGFKSKAKKPNKPNGKS